MEASTGCYLKLGYSIAARYINCVVLNHHYLTMWPVIIIGQNCLAAEVKVQVPSHHTVSESVVFYPKSTQIGLSQL